MTEFEFKDNIEKMKRKHSQIERDYVVDYLKSIQEYFIGDVVQLQNQHVEITECHYITDGYPTPKIGFYGNALDDQFNVKKRNSRRVFDEKDIKDWLKKGCKE